MPIVAICPYCRAGGVRAPDSAVGSSATCPTCRSSFTVVPSDQPVAAPPKPAQSPAMHSVRPDAPPVRRPALPPTAETLEHSSPIDRTEPSPVLPPEPSGHGADVEPREPIDAGYALALVGVTLFGVGMTAAQLAPFGRVIGLFACVLGGAAGVLSLGAEGRARLVGAVGAGLNAVAVLLLGLLPGWLALPEWRAAEEDEPTGPRVVSFRPKEVSAELPDGWIDSRAGGWAGGDFRVSVRSAYAGPLDLVGPDGAKRQARDRYLRIHVRVKNGGFKGPLDLTGWAAGADPDGPRLTDPAGKVYKAKRVDGGWEPAGFERKPAAISPGNAADVLLLFEPPPLGKRANIDYLRLELPGGPVGSPDPIKFRVPGPF